MSKKPEGRHNFEFQLPSTLLGRMPQSSTNIDVHGAARYLERYIAEYRKFYEQFVAPAPAGRGFPDLRISPYLYSSRLSCYIADDGYVIWDGWDQPTSSAMIITPPSDRTEPEIQAETGRVFSMIRGQLKNDIQGDGDLGTLRPTSSLKRTLDIGIHLDVRRFPMTMGHLVWAMFFGHDLWAGWRTNERLWSDNYWSCKIMRHIGTSPHDSSFDRYYHYLEMSPDVHIAAWDPKTAWARVQADLVRDFVHTLASLKGPKNYYSSISFGSPDPTHLFRDRLEALAGTIAAFENLLDEHGDGEESIFQDFLKANPVLIDVYGEVTSQPQWNYPLGELSPIKKQSLEPDFVVRYLGDIYMLVEIERPSKLLGTAHGEPRHDVSQAAFQLTEWRDFIDHHYDMIKDKFPHITSKCKGLIVIGRSRSQSIGRGIDLASYKRLLAKTYPYSEVYTYDDLLLRAKMAYDRLCALPFTQ
jgi:Domain of unknown function (DUF4263)